MTVCPFSGASLFHFEYLSFRSVRGLCSFAARPKPAYRVAKKIGVKARHVAPVWIKAD